LKVIFILSAPDWSVIASDATCLTRFLLLSVQTAVSFVPFINR